MSNSYVSFQYRYTNRPADRQTDIVTFTLRVDQIWIGQTRDEALGRDPLLRDKSPNGRDVVGDLSGGRVGQRGLIL